MWRLLYGLPGWILYTVLMLPLVVLGFPLIALACLYDAAHGWLPGLSTALRDSDKYQGRFLLAWKWRVLWIYGNEEDGIDGSANGFWPQRAALSWGELWQIFRWSAWRNSVGNARWTRVFGMTVDPDKRIEWPHTIMDEKTMKLGPYVCQQGWRYELRFPWSATRFFWIGWRIAQCEQKTEGVGFAFQPWGKL